MISPLNWKSDSGSAWEVRPLSVFSRSCATSRLFVGARGAGDDRCVIAPGMVDPEACRVCAANGARGGRTVADHDRRVAPDTQASASATSVGGVPVVLRPVLNAHPHNARRIRASSGRPHRATAAPWSPSSTLPRWTSKEFTLRSQRSLPRLPLSYRLEDRTGNRQLSAAP
jgi:hypothetical protein